jgi:hypothetical protein
MPANAAFLLLLVGSVGVAGWVGCPAGIARTQRAPVAQPCAMLRRSATLMAAHDDEWTSDDDSMLAKFIGERSSLARCGRPDRVLSGLNDAWVLIFNAGRDDEGVYTLQGRTSRSTAYVLAFEFLDDADRFAELLQAESFDLATPHNWDVRQLSAFCDVGDFEVSLVPQVRACDVSCHRVSVSCAAAQQSARARCPRSAAHA